MSSSETKSIKINDHIVAERTSKTMQTFISTRRNKTFRTDVYVFSRTALEEMHEGIRKSREASRQRSGFLSRMIRGVKLLLGIVPGV